MLKENTVITLYPEDMFRHNAILPDEDRDAALDFLANVVKKKGGGCQQASLPPGIRVGAGQDAGNSDPPTRGKAEALNWNKSGGFK